MSKNVTCVSAGIAALSGHAIDASAGELLIGQSIDPSAHRATQLTPAMLREADLALGMERGHVAAMTRMAPEASGKIFLFDKWLAGRDIPDPYRQGRAAFEQAFALIEQGVASWLRYL